MQHAATYKDLVVWQRAIDLVVMVYRCSSRLPKDERFGLCSQIRRAAVSIPSNIAEGSGRIGKKEVAYFLAVSRGSLRELETLSTIARELGYIDAATTEKLERLASEVGRMLTGLRRSVEKRGS